MRWDKWTDGMFKHRNIIVIEALWFFIIVVYPFLFGDEIRMKVEELQSQIPHIVMYHSDRMLDDVIDISVKDRDRISAYMSFPLPHDGSFEEAEQYYTERLLELGWEKKNAHKAVFDKDGYTLTLSSGGVWKQYYGIYLEKNHSYIKPKNHEISAYESIEEYPRD